MKKCGVTWFIWVRADTGKTKPPYLLIETEAEVNSHILWFVCHAWTPWGRTWTRSSIGVQTYTNMSYRQKGSKNRSQTTQRNVLLREHLREASGVRFKPSFAKQIQAPHPGDGVPETECWFRKAENSVSLRAWSHFHGTTATNNLDTRKEGISSLDGKKLYSPSGDC